MLAGVKMFYKVIGISMPVRISPSRVSSTTLLNTIEKLNYPNRAIHYSPYSFINIAILFERDVSTLIIINDNG